MGMATVSLGGVTLTAHLTAGHTAGCTTWTTTASENGKPYDVVFGLQLALPNVYYAGDRSFARPFL